MTSLPPPVRPIPTPVTQEPSAQQPGSPPKEPTSPTLLGNVDITAAEQARKQEQGGAERRAAVAEETMGVIGPQGSVQFQEPDMSELLAIVKQGPQLLNADRDAQSAWLKAATDALSKYRMEENLATLQHLARQSQISVYAAQTQEGADQQRRVQTLDEIGLMSQWSDTRSPEGVADFQSAISPYLQDQDPEIVRKATEIADYHQRRQLLQRGYDMDVAELDRLAKEAVRTEADDWLRAPKAIATEALYSTFFKTQGGPQERIQSKLLEAVESRAARYKDEYERNPYKGNKDRVTITPEAYRSTLLHHAMTSAAKEIGDKDISEGFVERTLRGAAGFTGLPAVGAVGAAGKLITRADKIADVARLWKAEGVAARGLRQLGTMAPKLVSAGSIGAFIYTSSRLGIPGLRETGDIALMDEDEATRAKAKEARAIADTLVAGITLPVFAYARQIGRVASLGLLGKTTTATLGGKSLTYAGAVSGTAASVLGFLAGTEGATKVFNAARTALEENAPGLEETLSMWQLTHPKAVGNIEAIVRKVASGDPTWESNAMALAEEAAAGMVFFGLAHIKAAFARSQLHKRDIEMARADIAKAVSDPAVRKELDEQVDELEKLVPDPTAKDELVERLGEAAANEKIEEATVRRRIDRLNELAIGRRRDIPDADPTGADFEAKVASLDVIPAEENRRNDYVGRSAETLKKELGRDLTEADRNLVHDRAIKLYRVELLRREAQRKWVESSPLPDGPYEKPKEPAPESPPELPEWVVRAQKSKADMEARQRELEALALADAEEAARQKARNEDVAKVANVSIGGDETLSDRILKFSERFNAAKALRESILGEEAKRPAKDIEIITEHAADDQLVEIGKDAAAEVRWLKQSYNYEHERGLQWAAHMKKISEFIENEKRLSEFRKKNARSLAAKHGARERQRRLEGEAMLSDDRILPRRKPTVDKAVGDAIADAEAHGKDALKARRLGRPDDAEESALRARVAEQVARDAADGVSRPMTEVRAQVEREAPQRNIKEALTVEQDQEVAARELLDTELEREDVTKRAEALDAAAVDFAARQEVAQADRAAAEAPPADPTEALANALANVGQPLAPIEVQRQALSRGAGTQAAETVKRTIVPGDRIDTARGEIEVDSVEPDGMVVGRAADGDPVVRRADEILSESPRLVSAKRKPKVGDMKRGRPKKVEATPADREAAETEGREARLKAHEERIRQAERDISVALQKAQRITDPDERSRYLEEAAEKLSARDIDLAMEAEAARLERMDDIEAPPPGEDALPEEATPTVRFIGRASDMAQMLAKAKSWSKLEAPEGASGEARSLLETAKQREPFYKNLEGEAKAAQAVYDHLRITELGAPGESLSFEYSAILKRLDDLLSKSPDIRATTVQSLMEHHADLLTGEYAPVARMHPIGRAVIQRLEQTIAAYPKDLASGKLTIPSAADLKKLGLRAYTAIRSLWPWSTQSGWNFKAYAMSPRASLEMAKNNMANYLGDPSTKKSSWTRWFGAAESHDRGIGYALAHEMKVISAKTEAWLKAEVEYIKGLSVEERVALAEKTHDGSWRDETDPAKKALYQAQVDKMAKFRDGLWEVHPDNYHGLRRRRVAQEFVDIAKAAPPGPHRDLQVARAEAYLKKVEKWHEEDRVRWARKDFVHHVRAATAFRGSSFSIGKRRRDPEDISPEAGDWIRDIAVANLDYGPKAIAAMHKNKVNRDTFEYLYGRQRAAKFNEITTSGQRLFIDDVPHISHGVVYVVEKKGKSGKIIEKIVPMRAEVPGAFEVVDGQKKKVWKDVDPPKGAKKRLLVEAAPDDPSQGLYRGSRARTVNLIRQMNSHGQVAAKLIKIQDAVLSATVVEPGFMANATEQRQAEIKSLFNRFNWGIDHLATDVGAAKEAQLRGDAEASGVDFRKEIERDKSLAKDLAKGISEGIGRLGLLSTKLKMTGVGSPLNVLLGGLSMNSAAMPMNYMARAKKWASQAAWRYSLAKFKKSDQIDPAAMKPGDADWEKGRSHMRTNPKKLAKMSPDQMRLQEILDDAYVDMTASGLADHSLLDLDKRLPVKEGEIPTVKSIKRAMRPKFWDVALSGVRQADVAARMHNYLGIYVMSREAGKGRAEAHEVAMQSVAHNHGIFNIMTANPLLTSNFGKFALGLNGYVSRQFFIWAQAPLQYKLRFAAMTWGTNYIAQQIGLGDITPALGTSVYDTVIGGLVEEVLLGGEEPLGPDFLAETGHLPFHMPTSSPMISALIKVGGAVKATASGDYQEGLKGIGTAASAAFRPAIIDSLNKAGLLTGLGSMLGLKGLAKPHEQDAEGNHLVVSFDQKLLGTNRTSYKLKHQGALQLVKDALSGSQEEVARETIEMRVERAQRSRLEGQRANIKAQLRGLIRRYDEAQAEGKLTQTMRETTNAEFKRLAEEGRKLGINLADPSVRKQEFATAREQNLVAKLPPTLRGIATAGSKELQVRFLTDALGRATEAELRTLKTAIAGDKSLIEWARDPKRVSPDTYRDFTAAIRAWRSSRAVPAPASPSTPR